jgi:hypothetical protein
MPAQIYQFPDRNRTPSAFLDGILRALDDVSLDSIPVDSERVGGSPSAELVGSDALNCDIDGGITNEAPDSQKPFHLNTDSAANVVILNHFVDNAEAGDHLA